VLGLRETEILDLADPRLDKPAIKILRFEAEIATVDDLAELSIDELLDIQRLDKEVASAIIMTGSERLQLIDCCVVGGIS
jgi:transcription termination factor NusA